jgi:hypothetical protein
MHLKPQPMFVVLDVVATSAWYQADPNGYKVVVASPCGDVGPAPGGA